MRTGINADVIRQHFAALGIPKETTEAFLLSWQKCPEVWIYFERFALQDIASGEKNGSKEVMGKVRWKAKQFGQKGKWKCDNSITSYYVRVFELKYPEHKGYFETRSVRGLKVGVEA